MQKDYYSILGVAQHASPQEIRERFLDLARQHHPDLHHGADKAEAEEAFQEFTQAFNVLSDPDRRREIDEQLARPEAPAQTDRPQASKVYLQRGIKAYRARNYAEAAENFTLATQQDAKDARAWSYLAQACQHQPRLGAKARKAIATACQLEPMNATYLKLAGKLFTQAEMYARAEKYYVAAQNWGGDDADVEQALATLRKLQKKTRSGLFGRE